MSNLILAHEKKLRRVLACVELQECNTIVFFERQMDRKRKVFTPEEKQMFTHGQYPAAHANIEIQACMSNEDM